MRACLFFVALAACAPAAAPLSTSPEPVRLSEVWRTHATGSLVPTAAGPVLAEIDGALVAIHGDGVVSVVGANLRPVGILPHQIGGFAATDGTHLIGLDRTTLAPSWSIACPAGSCSLIVRGSDRRLVGAGNILAPGMETGLFALDRATGRELWRTKVPFESLSAQIAADDEHALLVSSDGTAGFDMETGRQLWSRQLENPRFMLSHGARVVLRGGVAAIVDPFKAVHVIDPASGDDRLRVPFEQEIRDVALDDTSLYVVGTRRFVAFDVESGRLRFERTLAGYAAGPALVVDRADVGSGGRRRTFGWIRTSEGETAANNGHADTLWAFDLVTGDLVGERDLGENESMAVARGAFGNGVLVADVPGANIVALALGPRSDSEREADVVVHVRAPHQRVVPPGVPVALGGLSVRVGAAVARTDDDGVVRMRARGIGVARVELENVAAFAKAFECPAADPAFLDFGTREASYDLDVVVRPRHCK